MRMERSNNDALAGNPDEAGQPRRDELRPSGIGGDLRRPGKEPRCERRWYENDYKRRAGIKSRGSAIQRSPCP